MKQVMISTMFVFMMLLLLNNSAALASSEDCSFSTMVTTDEYSFNVSSQPAEICEKQTVRVSVLKHGMPFTQFASSSDALIEKAWAEDFDEDGNFELLILSRSSSEPLKKNLEIFSVDGSALKQIRLPKSDLFEGYRGGDTFVIGNGKITRTYPVYLAGDVDGYPKGGNGVVTYQYRNREVLLVVAKEKPMPASSMPAKKPLPVKASVKAVKIKSIKVQPDYIEILADGSVDDYKVTRIANPWRLILDIPKASSDLLEKDMLINKHGISRIRVGVYKDKVRLVFDSAVSPMPTETVTQAENSLRIGFYQPAK